MLAFFSNKRLRPKSTSLAFQHKILYNSKRKQRGDFTPLITIKNFRKTRVRFKSYKRNEEIVNDYSQNISRARSTRKSSYILRSRKSRKSMAFPKKRGNQDMELLLSSQKLEVSAKLETIYNNLFEVLECKIRIQLNRLDQKSEAIRRRNGRMLNDRKNKMDQMEKRFGKNRVFYFKQNTIKKIGRFFSDQQQENTKSIFFTLVDIFTKIRKQRAELHERLLFQEAYRFPLELLGRDPAMGLQGLNFRLSAFDQFYIDKYLVIKDYLLFSLLRTNRFFLR